MTDESPGYSRRSLARLAFSMGAAQLADLARVRVPTTADSWGRPGELLNEARALVVAAEELVEKAVVFERESGTSWTVLGEVLGISKQGAQQKYGALVDDWAEALDQSTHPTANGPATVYVPGEGSESPVQHAEQLDAWVVRHAEKPSRPQGKKPVSGGLDVAGLSEQVNALARLARRMRAETDPVKLRAFHECKATVLTRVAKASPDDVSAAEAAEDARKELANVPARVQPARARQQARPALRLVHKADKPKRDP